LRDDPIYYEHAAYLKHEHGPFDIIGDVHGCVDELAQSLTQLGYQTNAAGVFRRR
jgi:hypothetical protein